MAKRKSVVQLLDNSLSVQTLATVRIRFEKVMGADVCVVGVAASGRPAFSKPHDGGQSPTDFWVRIGNATKQLHGDDMVDYKDDHWG